MDLPESVFGQTQLHPTALAFTALMTLALVIVRRQYAVVPLLLVACFMPVGQRIVIASIDIDMIRIALLAGWVRVLLRRELSEFRPGAIDWLFLGWRVVASLLFTLRRGDLGSAVLKAGESFDALGCYFLLRALIRSPADVLAVVRVCSAIAVPLGSAMLLENLTGRNLFAAFGGVPEFTVERAGRLRSMGAFPHPIMAGSVAASFFPLCVALWLARPQLRERALALAGVIGSTLAVMTSASSGPLMALVVAALGMVFWPLRRYLRVVLWSMAGMFAFLAFYMKQPIWHLFARVNVVGGSTGWHRAALIESAVENFREWGLAGVDESKGYYIIDVTNHYLIEGVRSGFVNMLLFSAIPIFCFRAVGSTIRAIDRLGFVRGDDKYTWKVLTWSLGCGLLAHAFSFTGVGYFGQALLLFYVNVAVIAANQQLALDVRRAVEPAPAPMALATPAGRGAR